MLLVSQILKKGGIAVLPTDTLYGICGSALQPKTVETIYRLRSRNLKKPMIVLIPSLLSLKKFGVALTPELKKVLAGLWPGKVSVVLPVLDKEFKYLHRGTKTVAFRLPDQAAIKKILKESGPLVAPSANPEGETPARTLRQAEDYFEDKVTIYMDGGTLKSKPSTLVSLKGGIITVLRAGAVAIKATK